MGTRGAVAWIDEKGKWKGVYNHFDSYPSHLGEEVYDKCFELGVANVVKRLQTVGDWREFISGGVCEFCGKVAGQPHSYSVNSKDYYNEEEKANVARTGFPDPSVKHHKHGRGAKDQFDPRKDPLFIEWVYVLIPEDNCIEVWHFVNAKERNPALQWTAKVKDGYTHVLVNEWLVGEYTPEFKRIEDDAYRTRKAPQFREKEKI
jgi:hypothetical protein